MTHSYPRFARLLPAALLLLLTGGPALAQQPATLLRDEPASASPLAAALTHARPLRLDPVQAQAVLADAPPETQPAARPLELSLPLPDGTAGRFLVWQTAVMAPALAAQFPDIRTYTGRGVDDATATVRLDLTPQGFHAQVLSARTGTVYIEPARPDNPQHYLSFFARDVRPGAIPPAPCGVADKARRAAPAGMGPALSGSGAPAAMSNGGLLRTYRLAVAATGEYTSFHGGTVPLALAAIVTSVNRVNGIFETELAVRFQLVANNQALIYTNFNTDPYTDGDTMAMLPENQTTIDNVLGAASYDIGHVFGGAGGGGRGALASVCRTGLKGWGASTLGSPVGDIFNIRIVCHEFGHQFGANHSFNSSAPGNCGPNRRATAAWEPGSGTTIMSYAGNCGDDIQFGPDYYYHLGSLQEMRAHILSTSCATVVSTGNTPALVRVPASGKVLPIGTPFKLTATASDAERNPVLYNWTQMDLGSAARLSDPQVAGDNQPILRPYPPTNDPTRYFPRLADLVNNFTSAGERLPTVARRLTFQVAVRDVFQGTQGLTYGVTTSDSVKLETTSAAGPFVVTSPNTTLTWAGGSTQTVTWNVAGTTANGVNCQTVNVRLSTDGGLTYPTVLAEGVPNTGSASVRMPGVTTSTARIMVEAADNYFFDISNANFSINSPSPCPAPTGLTFAGQPNGDVLMNFTPVAGAISYTVTTVPATTTQTVTAGPVTLSGLVAGTDYTLRITSNCGASSSLATVTRFSIVGPECFPPSELAITSRTTTSAVLSFVPAAGVNQYTVTTVPATTTQTVGAGPVTLTGLAPNTTYTVRVASDCANGATAPTASLNFRTQPLPPTNDLCANALPLTCGGRVTGYTEQATATGDPTATCGGETIDQGGVFYTIVGNGGRLTLSTCDVMTNFDSKLFVFTGSCGAYTCVAGNDDTCGTSSEVSFTSVAGTTYYVMVSGWGEEVGNFALTASCGPLAARDAVTTSFEVWPNPTAQGTALRVTLPAAAQATATLRNILGQQVAERSFRGSSTEVATTGLAAGTYLLTVQVAGQAPAVRRVVVE